MADQSIHPAIPPSADTVEFELDGRKVTANKGETIIAVAAREGVHVPHYCWHPSLSVAGNCRLCLVEMHSAAPDGSHRPMPKPVIACQTTVAANSRVFTQSTLAKDCQNGMMEFLLLNHPLDCPICDRGGECQLQRYAMDYGSGHSRFRDQKRKFLKPQFDPLIDIERNRCIMCTRCVRFSDEVAGEHVMGVFARGEANYIGTFGRGPVSNIFSGNVIDLCPVGCLTSKPFRFRARVWELTQTQSTGVFDASGPKVTHWTRNGKLYRTTPPSRKYHDTYTVNEDTEEFIDNLTRFGSDFGKNAARWDESRVRLASGTLLPAAHQEAIRQAATALAHAKVNHGAGSIAVLVSPRATMEEGYLAGKFARVAIGTDSVDWRSSMRSKEVADAFDLAVDNADGDLSIMYDAMLVVNGEYQHTVPTLALQVKEWARIMNRPLIMLGHYHDPYLAAAASVRLTVPPGKTAEALERLLRISSGPEATEKSIAEFATLCGTTAAQVKEAVETMRKASRGLILHSLDEANGLGAPTEVPLAVRLRRALGDHWGYIPTVKDRNSFGLSVVGAEPGRLPGTAGATVKSWQVENVSASGGVPAPELLSAIKSGKIKALVCFGADALHNFADDERVLAALAKLEFFALSDLFDSPYTQKAQVFFGAASNLERNGTYTDAQGNLARLSKAEEPSGGARPDWETITALARAMGAGGFEFQSVQEVFDEMMELLAPGFLGSFDGLLLPGPDNDLSIADPGGARTNSPEYNPGDFRLDGAHFRQRSPDEPEHNHHAPLAAEAGEGLVLLFGEHVQGEDYHLNHASIAHLLKVAAYAEFNENDAENLEIEENQMVELSLTDGTTWQAAAHVVKGGPALGCVWVPNRVGPVNLSGRKALPRVKVTPLAERAETGALAAAGMTY